MNTTRKNYFTRPQLLIIVISILTGQLAIYSFSAFAGDIVGRRLEDIVVHVSAKFESGLLRIIPGGGDLEGQVLGKGEVLYQMMNFEHPKSLPVSVSGVQKQDGQYKMDVKIGKNHTQVVSIEGKQGARVKKIAGGYRISNDSETDQLDFVMTYDSEELKKYADSDRGPLVVMPISIESGDAKQLFYNQVAPEWDIILTRFLVEGRGYEGMRKHLAAKENPSVLAADYRFNEYLKKQKDLFDDWIEVRELAKARPQGTRSSHVFSTGEKVIMGWERYVPGENSSFDKMSNSYSIARVVAGDSSDKNNISAYLTDSPITVKLGLEIYQHPKVKPPAKQQPSSTSSGSDKPDDDFGEEFFYENDVVDFETLKEIWRTKQVDQFALTLNKINTDSYDLQVQASDQPGYKEERASSNSGQRDLFDYFLLSGINNYGEREEKGSRADYPIWRMAYRKNPGAYELRLQMVIVPFDDINIKKELDVAIRFCIVDQSFAQRLLDWEQKRMP